MLNGVEVVPLMLPPLDGRLYPFATVVQPCPLPVATPATAGTVVVPERVPLPGFAPSAIVTLPVKPVAVFPCPSSAVTCTAGVMDAPAAVLVGCTVNASWVAVPGAMVNAALVAPVTPVALTVSV